MSFHYDVLEKEAELLISLGGGGYSWHLVDVWQRREDGRLFMYSDGGCSCDTPYDEYSIKSWDDLYPVTTVEEFLREVDKLDSYDRPDSDVLFQEAAVLARAMIGDRT